MGMQPLCSHKMKGVVYIHPHLYIPLYICMIKALSLHTVELQLAPRKQLCRAVTQVFRYLQHQSNLHGSGAVIPGTRSYYTTQGELQHTLTG